jgi:predicted ABC-type transport system involved in lysophospholipase L1 biosynthesis ATPase subunit
VADSIIDVRGVKKDYGGLRPLRLAALTVGPGDRVAIAGLDAPAAEILVNILTGATLPDEGEVRLFGRLTSAIADADDWLLTLDRIGMVSPRAMLADEFTVRQCIALAFSLSIDPVPESVAGDVARLSAEAGLSAQELGMRVSDAAPMVKARCRLARSLATSPAVLVLEHANALVADGAEAFGREIAALARTRGMALLALTADETFASAVAERVFAFDAATGQLKARGGWRRWFS